MASISLYGYEALQPGNVQFARIILSEPIVLVPGDRFVLRQPSPAGTIGGGCVLDAHPEPRQKKAATLAWLEQLAASSPTRQVELRIARRDADGITFDALSSETGLTIEAIQRHIIPGLECGDLQRISSHTIISREALLEASEAIMTRLQHGRTAKSSELQSHANLSRPVFEFLMNLLVANKKVLVRDETVSIGDALSRAPNAETETLAAVSQIYESAGLASPSVPDVACKLNLKEAEMRRLVTILQRANTLVRMGSDDLFIHAGALKQLAAQFAPLRGSVLDVARFKEITGLSRKYAIPLLEYLDRQRVTRKEGDKRLIL